MMCFLVHRINKLEVLFVIFVVREQAHLLEMRYEIVTAEQWVQPSHVMFSAVQFNFYSVSFSLDFGSNKVR